MPARPLADETLHLIDAVRNALAAQALPGGGEAEERRMFGGWSFLVDGKLCLGVKGTDLLVRLPPERHAEFQEMQGTRELSPGGGMQGYFWVEPSGYATRAQWRFWLDEALAFNPRAKASPRRRKPAAAPEAAASAAPARPGKRHSIFEADDD